jgi:hypothetical protein
MNQNLFYFGKKSLDALNYIASCHNISFKDAVSMCILWTLELTKLQQVGVTKFKFKMNGEDYNITFEKGSFK